MTTSFLLQSAENNDKDFQIAKLKAEAFDVRQKARDYQRLHTLFTELSEKHGALTSEEKENQQSCKQKLHSLTSETQSLQRELDELRAIYCD